MQLIFFFPEIYRFSTGGNVFNWHLQQQLKKDFLVKTIIVNQKFQGENSLYKDRENSFWLVDSLLLQNDFWLEFLCKTPAPNKFLLLHYLRLLDPTKHSAEVIQKEKSLLSIFNGFIATSFYSQQILIRAGINLQQIVVIRPGVERRNWPAIRPGIKQIPRILTVSSIFPGKGLLELIGMMEKLHDLKWSWDIIGENRLVPSFTSLFRKELRSSAIAERVKVHSPLKQKDLFKRYSRSDLFVLPSHFETCSMVTMEAMVAGLPVIAWKVGGLPELVEDQQTGYLIPFKDQELFLEKLRELISSSKIRQRFAAAAKKKSASFGNWQESSKKLAAFLKNRTNQS
jgi:glycosyltransferase involved in cell wall biosynthesis